MSRSTVAPASAFSAVERAIRAIGDEERKVLVRLKAGRAFNDTVHQELASRAAIETGAGGICGVEETQQSV